MKSIGRPSDADTGSGRRLLRVLSAFKADTPLVTAEELARRIGLPLSSTYRYLGTLREAGLVEDHGRRGFAAGAAAIRLAAAARAANPIETIGRPHVQQLMMESGETVVLLRRLNLHAICIAGAESSHILRMPAKIGSMCALHRGAGPMILFAGLTGPLSDQVMEHYITRYEPTSACVAELRAELRRIASRGWAICDGGVFPGVFAAAAPVRDDEGVVASIAVVAPSFRVLPDIAARLRHQVTARAAIISDELRGRSSIAAEAAE